MIRPATLADAAAMRALLVETWHATYDAIYGPERVTAITDTWHSVENLTRQIEAGLAEPERALVLVAEEGEALVATAAARLNDEGIDLARLYVRPGYQGRGHGSALLQCVIGNWPQAARIHCEVEPANAPALRFYERAGFGVMATGAACGGDTAQAIAHLILERRRP